MKPATAKTIENRKATSPLCMLWSPQVSLISRAINIAAGSSRPRVYGSPGSGTNAQFRSSPEISREWKPVITSDVEQFFTLLRNQAVQSASCFAILRCGYGGPAGIAGGAIVASQNVKHGRHSVRARLLTADGHPCSGHRTSEVRRAASVATSSHCKRDFAIGPIRRSREAPARQVTLRRTQREQEATPSFPQS
jgi:hypothetical protein